MGSLIQNSTTTLALGPAQAAATTGPIGANAAHCRSGGHPPVFYTEVDLDEAPRAFDGSASALPLIAGYHCPECGAHGRPGAGVHRQSNATVNTRHGPLPRGGRCQTCRRVAGAAERAYAAAFSVEMACVAGKPWDERQAVMREAIRRARVAKWQVIVRAALRARTRAEAAGAS